MKMIKRFGRFILWSGAFILGALILLQIVFWSSLWWVSHTKSGQNFLQAQLGKQLEGSGYDIRFNGLSFASLTSVYLGGLDITQNDQPLFNAKGLRIKADIFPLSDKKASVFATISELIIHPAPKPTTPQPAAASATPIIVTAFDLPDDLPFNDIQITELSIDRLVFKGEKDTVLSPLVKGDISLKDNLIAASIKLDERNKALPVQTDMKLTFDTQKSKLSITSLNLSMPELSLTADGNAVFRKGKYFDVKGLVSLKNVASVEPIKFKISAENTKTFPVQVQADSGYEGYAARISARLTMDKNTVRIKPLSVSLPDVTASGTIDYNMDNAALNGALQGRVESFKHYQSLIGTGHNIKPLDFQIALSPDKTGFKAQTTGYKNNAANIAVKDISLDGAFSGQVVTITSLMMHDEEDGVMNATGTYDTASQIFDFSASVKNLRAIKGEIANGSISAEITAKGNADAVNLSGVIQPNRIEITLPQKFQGAIPQLNIQKKDEKPKAPAKTQIINLDLLVDAKRNIFVKGYGLDSEFGGKIDIKGKASNPQFGGTLNIIRGKLEQFGKKFEVTKGVLTFAGSVPPSPSLDILVETDTGDVVAQIAITGNALKPEIDFSSEPSMPEDEIMAQILFGKGIEDLSPLQIAQIAQKIAAFTGVGGGGSGVNLIDPVGALQSAAGLDDVRFDAESGAASFGAGKQLSDKVYLDLEGGTEPGSSGATLEIELTPSITIESQIGSDAQGGASIFWERDY